ncbi:MAG: hypothetical protein M3198_00890 [Actinomycetota bacterium]|nr:hypothetical protein [Actinomycetota bacterium]
MKKILGAVAAKQVIDKINERRKPKKPSLAARLGRFLLIGGGAAAGFYAYKSGGLEPLLNKVRGGSDSASGSAPAESNGAGEGNNISFRSEDQPLGAPVG